MATKLPSVISEAADAMRLSIKFWLRWVDYKREAGVEVGETIGKVR